MGRLRMLGLATLIAVGVSSCSSTPRPEPRVIRSPEPSAAPTRRQMGLCQPFPDRLIDDLIAANNDRDLAALDSMVTASPIEDIVPAAYGGEATFDDVTEWAKAGWEADDRMKPTGYSAFYPTKRGF